MSWLYKVAQWWTKNISPGEHLHQAFSNFFHLYESTKDEWPEPHLVVYAPESVHTDNEYQIPGVEGHFRNFPFFFNDRFYVVEVKWNTLAPHSLTGELSRKIDHMTGELQDITLGKIMANNPLDFAKRVDFAIRSDRRDDNNEYQDPEPEPSSSSPELVPLPVRQPKKLLNKEFHR